MPLDAGLLDRSHAALGLWRDLQRAYDDIAQALAGGAGRELGALAERIVALEHELKPLVAERTALRTRAAANAGAELDAVWRETDAVIEALAERQPALVRAALAARHETAQRLHDAQRGRARARSYDAVDASPRLASRRA
jgi:hypothetical protein